MSVSRPASAYSFPTGAVVEPVAGLQVKGKSSALDAYVLPSLPA